jgi:hypothetical protein
MAIENINNKTDGIYDDVLPQTQLKTIFRSSENKFYLGATNAKSLLQVPSTPVMANIGPFGDATLRGAVPTFHEANHIPVFGFRDRSAPLANKNYFPNFLRTIPGLFVDGRAIASLISKYFRWDKVTVFSSLSESSQGSSLSFSHYASQFKINILSSHVLPNNQVDLSEMILSAKKAGSRIFVLFLDPESAKAVIEQGTQLKLFTDNTQIIGGEELSTHSSWDSMNLPPETITALLKGVIGVRLHRYSPPSHLQDQFLEKWRTHRSTNGEMDGNGVLVCDDQMDSYNSSYLHQYSVDKNATPICAGLNYSSYSASVNLTNELLPVMYAYDAIVSVAMGLHHLIYSANNTQPTPFDLHHTLLYNVSFTGLTGEVSFATTMSEDMFNVGGRETGILYDIVNYASDSFVSVLQWHSEEGFPACDGIPYFKNSNPCHQFVFQSQHPPTDSPLPQIVQMPPSFQLILRILSVMGIIFSILVALVIYTYYSRRLVKISQPLLANFKKFGIFVGFVRVLVASFNLTQGTCISILWLEHIAFQMIFTTISVRCWRVYLVTGSLKRVKVTDRQCMMIILANIAFVALLLTAMMFTEEPELQVVTVIKNQQEYVQEHSCRTSSPLIAVIATYDLLVLVTGLWFCWLIRKVGSTVSNTPALIEGHVLSLSFSLCLSTDLHFFTGLVTTAVTIIVVSILLSVANLEPLVGNFVTSLAMALVLLRILWTFENEMIYRLFAGYELDRTLTLRQSEKTVLDRFMPLLRLTKVYVTSASEGSASENISSSIHSDGAIVRQLERLTQIKGRDEIIAEIERVKKEHLMRQQELGCLENLLFMADQEISIASKNSQIDSACPPPPSYPRDVECGTNGVVTYIPTPK